MTADEMLDELNVRIDRAVNELSYTYNPVVQHPRVEGKIQGLLLVKDWLRSYPREESPHGGFWELQDPLLTTRPDGSPRPFVSDFYVLCEDPACADLLTMQAHFPGPHEHFHFTGSPTHPRSDDGR